MDWQRHSLLKHLRWHDFLDCISRESKECSVSDTGGSRCVPGTTGGLVRDDLLPAESLLYPWIEPIAAVSILIGASPVVTEKRHT